MIRELAPEEAALAYVAMAELRPHLASPDELQRRVAEQAATGYRLVASFDDDPRGGADDEPPAAVAGFRVVDNLAWGRHLYVDDLVTRRDRRRRGHADALFAWLLEEAGRLGCAELHLDSGVQRYEAHRFYLTRGMDITSHHFARRVGD